jgi:gluconolactonase
MEWKFERVAGPFKFTEGPVWDGTAVLFTDIPNCRIMRYDPASGTFAEYRTDTNEANGLALDREGRLYACEVIGRRIARYEPDGTSSTVADAYDGRRLNSPNDLVVDPQGRIWFTDPRYRTTMPPMELDHESVYRLDPQPDGFWTVVRMTYDTTRPNGLIVTPDMKTLYVAQSENRPEGPRELRAYPILEGGTLDEYDVLHDFGSHRAIDGMTLDEDGNIVATAGSEQSGPGSMVYVFAPSGRVLETHPTPASPTNCTFGDGDLQTLYVTATDGCLYRARTGRRGLS